MIVNLKALVVVLAIAVGVFYFAKPLCLRFMSAEDFARRRGVWFALTITAFVVPSFWLYVAVALAVLAWSVRKDSNPVALYLLMLHVIPPVRTQIPVEFVTQLFDVNNYRVVAFAVLIPAAWRVLRLQGGAEMKLTWADTLLLSYCALQLILYVPYESITHSARRAFLLSIDVLVLYFVISRTCTNRRAIVEAMAALCLACALFAPMALFEHIKGWLLYEGLGFQWGNAIPFSYIVRGDSLRASVSAGHAIPLGYLMALGFGFWLYLSSRVRSPGLTMAVSALMWIGLLAAYSRAPWIMGVAVLFIYIALGPNGAARFFSASLVAAAAAGLVLLSPLGALIIDNLPFIGTVDVETVIYRERLAEASWRLISNNPLFGHPFYEDFLEDLRQGQGIIDLMNGYAAVALAYGLVGLGLLMGFFLSCFWNAYRVSRAMARADVDLSMVGASLVACMAGTLLMLAMGGFGGGVEKMFYVLAGLAAGYAQLARASHPAHARALHEAAPIPATPPRR